VREGIARVDFDDVVNGERLQAPEQIHALRHVLAQNHPTHDRVPRRNFRCASCR
jgi:hypothetical protein